MTNGDEENSNIRTNPVPVYRNSAALEAPPRLFFIPPKERGPGDSGPRSVQQLAADYWFGRRSCVNPVVLMSRNIGVRGGRSVGFRKFTSNW
jgi:hypothetical protein